MKRLSIALATAAAAFALSAPALAQQQQQPQQQASPTMEPGSFEAPRVWVNTSVFTGTVTGIDRAQRRLMAQDQNGNRMTLAVSPEVRNFENLQQGDQITMRYTEAEALALAKQTDQRQSMSDIRSKVESTARAQAPAGADRPGLGAVEQVTVVANVFDIDRQRGILTLRGPSGEPVDVMANPQALQQVDMNDQIVISFMEATAVDIRPADAGIPSVATDRNSAAGRDANR